MKYLASLGFGWVLIHDHRGHGKSVKTIDDLGYFYENGGPNLVKRPPTRLPGLSETSILDFPFLVGHSMGVFAVRVYLKHYERELDRTDCVPVAPAIILWPESA